MARYFGDEMESLEGLPEFNEADELFNQEWEAELDREYNPDVQQWRRGRTFNPEAAQIPSGPFQAQGSCPLEEDLQQLKIQIGPFDRHVTRLRQLVKQTPRNQTEIDAVGRVARQLQPDLIKQLEQIGERTRTGEYIRKGCTHREIPRAGGRSRSRGGPTASWCSGCETRGARSPRSTVARCERWRRQTVARRAP